MQDSKFTRRNFLALLFEGTFFFTGMAFLDANSVVPVFIDTFTGSLQLAGLAVALKAASSILAQLVMGPHVSSIRDMPSFITRAMFLLRPLPLLIIPLLLGGLNNHTVVVVFLILFSLLWVGDGIVLVPWLDLFGRVIPQKQRGRLFGYQQILGGIGSLAAGYIIKRALENPQLTNGARYAIIFGMGGLMLLISSTAMSFARDLPRKPAGDKVSIINYFRKMPMYFCKNPRYQRLVVVRILSAFSIMILPFVILFARNQFGLSAPQVSNLIYIQIVGTLVGGFFWGNVSQHLGNKMVILISQMIAVLLTVLAFVSLALGPTVSPMPILWLMSLLTGMNMGSWMGFVNYTFEIVEEEERPVYFVLNSVLTFPFTFVPYFAGLTADYWGFVPLFVTAGLAGIVTAILSTRLHSGKDETAA